MKFSIKPVHILFVLLAFAGCKKKDDPAPVPPPTYSVGGTASGIKGTVVLQNNGAEELTITSDGSFAFATKVVDGTSYNVTILSSPDDQDCQLFNASGKVSGGNVEGIVLSCKDKEAATFRIGGTVSGVSGTLVLVNGEEELSITENGDFVFPTAVPDGTEYDIKVKSSPEGQKSTVTNGKGKVSGADISNIAVACEDLPANTYTIGGTVDGMMGDTLVLENNGEEIKITSDGPFTFPTPLADGTDYKVTIKSQPEGTSCTITNNEGTVNGANVENVTVTCSDVSTYTIGGTLTGINGTLVISNNGVDELTITENGPFTFSIPLANGSPYDVKIVSQPDNEICSIENGSGMISGANITNIEISCMQIPSNADRYFATGSEDPSILYQFQSNLSLNALSTNGFGVNHTVVGLAYNPFSKKIYAYSKGTASLLEVSSTTGVATEIGALEININDLAFDKNTKKLYAVEASLGVLVQLDTTNAEISQVFQSDDLKTIEGLAFDPVNDKLYGTSANQKLLRIDIGLNTATEVGTTTSTYKGLAFDDDTQKLYGITGSEQGQLFEISTTNAGETDLGQVGYGNPAGLAFDDNINKIYGITDSGNGKLYLVDQSSSNLTVSIGSTGVAAKKGLAYSSTDDLLYTIGPDDLMYTLNESSGVSTFKYQIQAGIGNFGITYDDEGDQFYTVTGNQNLGIINRADGTGDVKMSTFTETIVDLAYDNENNVLYAASAEIIHVINTGTGEISSSVNVKDLPGVISAISYDPDFELIVAVLTEPQPMVVINPKTGDSAVLVDTGKDLFGIVIK